MVSLELKILSRSEDIGKVIDALEALGKANKLPPRIVHDMNVSLDEILSNIISHAYDAHTITVRLTITHIELVAAIDDDGEPFNPLTVRPPDLDIPAKSRAIGGLGVHFVKALMDDVAYVRRDNRNCLELKKNL
jgi:serine/threonine-protein kinase RsbW